MPASPQSLRRTVVPAPRARGSTRGNLVERRSHPRQRVNLEAYFQPCPAGPDDLWWGALVHDLCPGGIGLLTHCDFALGTTLALELLDPVEGATFECIAIVAHVRRLFDGNRMIGCRFRKPLSDDEVWLLIP